jgi:hypothetical protein
MIEINLSNTQKILFISAMAAIIVQLICIYCFLDKEKNFDLLYCFSYLFFSAFAYISYYKLVIP